MEFELETKPKKYYANMQYGLIIDALNIQGSISVYYYHNIRINSLKSEQMFRNLTVQKF